MVVVEKLTSEVLQNPPIDGRDIALTHLSRKILNELEIWEQLPAEEIFPIREARVMDGKSPYVLNFDNEDVAGDELGYLVSNHLIRKALYEKVNTVKMSAWLPKLA